MAAMLEIKCPNCAKAMKVPSEIVGKAIRCKACGTTFKVADPLATAPPAKPKPKAGGKLSAEAEAPIKFKDDPPPATAPAPKAGDKVARPFDDDDDDNANPYGVTKDDLDIPRCPHCAKELDPPDTLICLNCGYNLIERRRHTSKKVYAPTTGDYFKHWLPAILWIIVLGVILGGATYVSLNMRGWLADSFLAKDEKNPVTNAVEFYLPPFCFNIWLWIFSIYFSYLGFRFVIKRLVYDWRPPEIVKKS